MSGQPRIRIDLPSDRYSTGVLALFMGAATVLTMRCLGRADTAQALLGNNPRGHPLMRYGDTPPGLYRAAPGAIRFAAPIEGIGAGLIPLEPVSESALAAIHHGRDRIAILAGSGNGVLAATAGSVRVRDRDLVALLEHLGDAADFPVLIREDGEAPSGVRGSSADG